jgi:hypothetical protein
MMQIKQCLAEGDCENAVLIERLRAALKRYGLHTWECAFNDSKGEKRCDCGWAILQKEFDV